MRNIKSLKEFLEARPALKYVLEVVTIIIGISLSFAIENWREERQEEKIYKAILEEFILDLKEDSTNYVRGVNYRIQDSELIIKYLRNEPLNSSAIRNWLNVVGGRKLEIKQLTGGYIHWQNTPGITFQSVDLSLAISRYYDNFHKKLAEAYDMELDFFVRAQNFLIANPASILASFTHENDPRFPPDFFEELFTPEEEERYRQLIQHPSMRFMSEAKLFIITNERYMCMRGLDLSTNLLEKLYEELKRIG